ncbi:MAG TPA: hypothetical protein VKP30_25010 [Polyangiaceae bacterium]|nr:hypothetical protein [Polyangiaceae bacterium]
MKHDAWGCPWLRAIHHGSGGASKGQFTSSPKCVDNRSGIVDANNGVRIRKRLQVRTIGGGSARATFEL